MSLALISTAILLMLISETKSFKPQTNILDVRSNPLGISTKQDLIPVKLGISEKYPNTRIMAYIDINKDKL
jgi:hypothetical protein